MKSVKRFLVLGFLMVSPVSHGAEQNSLPSKSPQTPATLQPPTPPPSAPAANKLDFAVSTKIWRTQCVKLEENKDKSMLLLSVRHSRLAFSIADSDKEFVHFRTVLKEACQDPNKKIDLRYDEASQKLVMLRFSK